MFIDEGFTSFPFGRIKRIDFGNLGDERVLEFNGMVKGSMRGKSVICFFQEDISEISAEVRDWNFPWFLGLSELRRDGDLDDLFARSSCQKVILTERPVIFSRR